MKAYPHKVSYEEVYKMVLKSKENKELLKKKSREIASTLFPLNYGDIAKHFKITKQHISFIKKSIENENKNNIYDSAFHNGETKNDQERQMEEEASSSKILGV
jgi:siroheme synthase (precorrin-2 oxidase/ferrochelatase)